MTGNKENSTVKDLAVEPKEDASPLIMVDEKPAIFSPEEEAAKIEDCQYCGHYPCGCGG